MRVPRCRDAATRWCPKCGTCTCTTGQPRQWAEPGSNASCPMHGEHTKHGALRVITRRRLR